MLLINWSAISSRTREAGGEKALGSSGSELRDIVSALLLRYSFLTVLTRAWMTIQTTHQAKRPPAVQSNAGQDNMSTFRIPARALDDVSNDVRREDDDESSSGDEDDTWEDWVSDSIEKQPCKSLFDDTTLPSAAEALEHDTKTHGCDLNEVYTKLGALLACVVFAPGLQVFSPALDTHQRIRLVNYIRKEASLIRIRIRFVADRTN